MTGIPTFRWSSASSRIYVEGGGVTTLSAIHAALPNAPLCLIDSTNRVWFLGATLFVTDGTTVQLHGTAVGGDVNELLLRSDNSMADGSCGALDADWGTLDLNRVKVVSWDQLHASPDTEIGTFNRAFIRARSRQVGSVVQQSTLNVIDSEISHLGSNLPENYALTWQVIGSGAGVTVLGNVSGSYIHHCQLGVGTWSADNVTWAGNEIAFCTLYGFDATDPGHQAVLAGSNVHDNTPGATYRWSGTSGTIYVEGGGVATLSELKLALPIAPLQLTDPARGVWFLGANLVVTGGSTLRLHDPAAGGDVSELRLKSNNSSAAGSYVSVDADWGTIELNGVKVTSWNEAAGAPDTEYATYGRAYLRARSRQVGTVLQQSTLTVIDAEISHLGLKDSEGYALTWQVVGSTPGVMVFGTVSGSFIHHCQLGVGTWAVDDVSWTGNEIAFNTLYGFDAGNPGHQGVLAGNNVHDNDYGAIFRWSSSSQRIYVTGPGSATLSEIKAAVPAAPLTLVDPARAIWYLGANLFVENGAQLKLYGPAIGGDAAELRLKSDNTGSIDAVVELRADWGWLDFRNTKITSWDNAVGGPDTESVTHRRAYVRARSTLDPDGVTAHESRMDVINSEVSYLGSQNTEAYGLTWKVVDTSAAYLPPGSTNSLFDVVNVYGDILNSRIHHNHFGVYTYGHFGGQWRNNEVDHNIGYGFDPHDDSDNLVIENNHVHHNGWHGIIASKRCDHGVMRNNISHDNGLDLVNPHGNGIMLHRSCNDWLVESNQSYNHPDSGIAIFATDRALIRNNVCSNNFNAGLRMSVGSAENWVQGNQFRVSGKHGFYLYEGNDPPEPDDDGGLESGRNANNTFTNNFVIGYGSDAIKLQNADSNVFAANVFVGVNTQFRFANSVSNKVVGNSVPANTFVKLVGTNANPTMTVFSKQPVLTLQLEDNFSTALFTDDKCAIFDFSPASIGSRARPSGTTATMTVAEAGTGANTVVTRNFLAVPASGNILITPTIWHTGGDYRKEWTAEASSSGMQTRYTVGDLQPGAGYRVTRESLFQVVTITTVTANSQGIVTFESATRTRDPVTYAVSPL